MKGSTFVPCLSPHCVCLLACCLGLLALLHARWLGSLS
jgi:hypothetical protein